jgi:hypothetical protein
VDEKLGDDVMRINFEERYGVKLIARPYIKATKKLDLTDEKGKQIVQAEAERVLRTHKATLAKLSRM